MRVLNAAAALSCAVLFSVIGGGAANAGQIQSFDSGWYTNSGFTAGVNNINVGSSNLSGAIYHNWLAFNLAGLATDTVTGATLTFYGGNGVNTSSTSESLGLFDYTGSTNSLISDSQFNVGIIPIWATAIITARQSFLTAPYSSSPFYSRSRRSPT